ncbi:bifunctional copper resistance protein CopD/cytochrome c oxidase assembly protein [Nocardioides sp. ChNu-153]|uniref:bifunctional copper resistance protein CopD/cytochrome c oxidase assembly protein n=1 Tax=unclassified Nocardioides TaxID=2615069 RepID=UPI00240589FC|nr:MULTISPECIES: bifunctional copper resistance protein CopD/cytochrome c oxidase assembly protein [unclassified Nocardioides]MDF9716664.1 bifunctional copper resistance protein CopD/cytochrome c oxidase assembly protein [Nocardioides sp. ChNu-99]MDN7123047.1 bifunctional copper resistance protein CopD/cytochrome c oxidase assembly protein [Nocardioides sp. ChNu-153]
MSTDQAGPRTERPTGAGASGTPGPGTPGTPPRERRGLLPAALGALVVGAAAMWLLLELAGGAPQAPPAGIPDPGALTGWAIPALELVGHVAAVAVVSCFLVPLLVAKRLGDELGRVGHRATRAATWAGLVWLVAGLVQGVFTVSDLFADPVGDLSFDAVRSWYTQVSQGQAAATQAVMLLVLVVLSRWVATAREVGGLLGLSLLALVPPVLTGHSASSGSHDLAIVSMVAHVLAAVVWVGGVVALWWHLADAPKVRGRAARRFSAIAAWCFGATAASGVVNAWVRVDGAFLDSGYGRGALAKIAVLVVLGVVAWVARRRVVAGIDDDAAGRRTFSLLTGVELLWMSVAFGLGVALSRTPPPVGEPYASGAEALLGGPLPPAPDAANLLWGFNASGVGLLVVVGGLVAYGVGLRTLHRRGDAWPVLRTVAFVAGMLVVAYATLGGLGTYSHVLFSAHMVSHMLLSMVAPILLVAGAPVNLALQALPGSDVRGGQGPRQILAAVLQSRPARVLSHPVVTALLFVGSLYGVYFTGLFGWMMDNHLGHAWMELHFLITGYLFYESLVGIAPVPHRLPYLGRLGMLLLVAPFHAFFSIALMSSSTPVGGDFYARLERPYATDLVADQELGGSLSWAIGEIPILMVVLIVLGQWFRHDRVESKRHDRREASSDDAELKAYNERLAQIREHDGSR